MASKAIGFLNFKFGADLSGFERAMKKAQKSLKKFGKNVTKVGQNLSRNLTLPILGLGAAALKFGSDLEETDAKFKTVFSSIQKEAEKTAQSLKENFGLSELAAKQMLSGTGDLLVGFGFTEQKALELSNSVNELAVDLASFTNFSGGAQGASEALTKALLGERESIKSLGIAITETDLKAYAAEYGLVWKELDRVTKAQLTFEMAQKQSSKAIGDFERTSGSFANQMRIAKGDLVDIASEMGARLIPYAQAAIEKLKGLIKWFDGLSESQKDNIVKWGLILAAVGPVLIIIGKVATGISALIPIFVAIGGVIMSTVVPAFTALWAIMIANPFGAMLASLGLLAAGIAALVISNNDATDSTITLTESQKELQKEIEETARVERSLAFMRNNRAAQEIYIAERRLMFKEKLANANTKEEKQLAKAQIQLTDLRNNVAFWGQQLKETLDQEGYDISLDYYKDAQKAVEDQIEVVGKLQKLVKKLTGTDGDPEKKVKQMEALSLATHDTFEEISLLSHRLDGLEMPEGLFNTDPLKEYRGALGDLGEEMATFFGKDIEELEQITHDGAMSIGKNLAQGADSWEEYGQTIKNVIRETIGALISEAVMTAALSALTSVPFPLNIIAAGIAAGAARTAFNSMIPEFADGGLVYGPTTALIGEGVGTTASNPEVVAPLDKLKQHMGGGNQNIIVEGVLKGNDIYLSNKNTSVNRLRTT